MEQQGSNARPTDVESGLNNIEPVKTSLPPVLTKSTRFSKFNRKKVLFAVAGILIVIAGGSFFWHSSHKTPKAVPLTNISVRMEWVNNPEFAGMYVAQEKGFYRAVGLNVELKEFQDSTNLNKEVSDGTVDYGVSTPLELILARDNSEKNKAIAAIYQTSAFSFVAKKAANVKYPADFKGKILGKSGNNNEAAVTYAALMAYANLSPSDATLKAVDFDVLAAFNKNQSDVVDLYRTDQTYLLDQAHIPYSEIFPEQFGFNIYGDILIASDSTIAKKPAQTKAFVQATLKGWRYVIDHESEALTILAKHDNKLYQDPAYVKYDLDGTIPLIKPTGGKPLGSMEYVPWNRAYLAVQVSGLLKTSFDVSSTYTSEFVK
jgi:NitT/TauT family transport system substrate-binding protein